MGEAFGDVKKEYDNLISKIDIVEPEKKKVDMNDAQKAMEVYNARIEEMVGALKSDGVHGLQALSDRLQNAEMTTDEKGEAEIIDKQIASYINDINNLSST